ncbi:hypothetical protein ES703_06367 [subsurface metagenome]
MTDLERLLTLARAQFLSDPEAALALINSTQPNLVQAAPMGLATALAPGATTTVSSEVPEGFVCIITRLEFYTDVPFAVAATLYRDEKLWYVDPGLVPTTTPLRNWAEAAYRWTATYINTSAVDVNIHSTIGLYLVETQMFRNIMAVLAPLSYSISEHGTPELAPTPGVVGFELR